ncbi:phosphatidylethanolamine-binding protein [Podospora fimiseda]|uniref:Phosphatidylethanolamine-binding protein n=1 Tax=Podospora fimiseda TaxID=252190 RepID=A0AAN7BF31_9PEZI|nr:phosphatidylethanolamine-binding protein [Podospora fimiseda]
MSESEAKMATNKSTFIPLLLFLILIPQANTLPNCNGQIQHIMTSSSDRADTIRQELQQAEIIPTVIDDFVPSLSLSISWTKTSQEASLGNTLKPDDLQGVPVVSVKPLVPNQQSETNIVIVATDPDAPQRDDPKWAEFCHWIAVSSGSGSEEDGKEMKLDDVIEYKPPGPPKKTGKHRYVFLGLVPGNGTTDKLELSKPGERKRWGYDKEEGEGSRVEGVRRWARENGLVVIGKSFCSFQPGENAD